MFFIISTNGGKEAGEGGGKGWPSWPFSLFLVSNSLSVCIRLSALAVAPATSTIYPSFFNSCNDNPVLIKHWQAEGKNMMVAEGEIGKPHLDPQNTSFHW